MSSSRSKFGWLRPWVVKLGVGYIRWVGESTQWHMLGEEHYLFQRCLGKPLILSFWHQQLMLMPFCYAALNRGRKMAALISRSRDGQIVSDFIEAFGFEAVRGSSSRGGAVALMNLRKKIEEGYDLAITPDGPRGPGFQAQMGAIMLAAVSECPIIPVAAYYKKKKFLRSWDEFMIPYPYNEAVLAASTPIMVKNNQDRSYLESKKIELQNQMILVNRMAREKIDSL